MINFVVKRDGTKVPFDSEKIKSAVLAAASEAGITPGEALSTAQKVLDSVSMAFGDKEEVSAIEIKEKVLSELDTIMPDVAMAWKKYDQSMGK
jgi:transcriptional regulator NrdR family protein